MTYECGRQFIRISLVLERIYYVQKFRMSFTSNVYSVLTAGLIFLFSNFLSEPEEKENCS